MKEYLLLFRGCSHTDKGLSPEQLQTHMQKWMDWMGSLQREGKLIGAQPLTAGGKTVKGNNKIVSDGPFMEGKEMVGGYLACRAAGFDEAVEISKGCPALDFEDGTVEVREFGELNM